MKRPRTSLLGVLLFFSFLPACRSKQSGEQPVVKKPVVAEPQAAKPEQEKPPARAPTAAPKPTEQAPEAEPTPAPAAQAPAEEPGERAGATAPSEAPAETDLVLLGIVHGQSPSALIEHRGSQEVFRKGDSVFDQGTLREIGEESVVIRSGKKDTTLRIRKTAAEAPPPTPEARVVDVKAPPVEESSPVAKPIPRAEARGALENLSKILGEAQAHRVAVGGGHGLQLDNVSPASFLAKLGLKSGDVLQKLNGVPIDDPAKLPDFSAAAERSELAVSLVRKEIGLTFSRPIQ